MKKFKKCIATLAAIGVLATAGGAFSLRNASATETDSSLSKVTATYSGDGTNTASAYLDKLEIKGFDDLTDFTDWFALSYNSASKTVSDYVTVTTDGTAKISASSAIGFRLKPDNAYGYAEFGNFEVKFTVQNVKPVSGAHVYFASRLQWDSGDYQYSNSAARTIISNGASLTTWGDGASVQTGANKNVPTTGQYTLTMGWIDTAWYYYLDTPTETLDNCSIYTVAHSANSSNAARDGNQTFGFDLLAGAEFEIVGFTFERLSTEKYPYSAPTATAEASANLAKARLQESIVDESKTYEDFFYDFTDQAKVTENEAFLDGLYKSQSTYSAAGTEFEYTLGESGYSMKNTTENSYGTSWATLNTNQYVSSVVMLDVEVLSGNFELFLRTGSMNSDDMTVQGYHVVISVKGGYAYLKAESRHGGKLKDFKMVNLENGSVKLCVVTEKFTENETDYTRLRLYTAGLKPVIEVTDKEMLDRAESPMDLAQKAPANNGNIAFGLRNEQTTKAESILKKLAIYKDTTAFTWPNENFGGQSAKDGIADMSYAFTSMTTEKTEEFINLLSVRHRTQEGTLEIGENGELDLKNSSQRQYGLTEYAFNALSLGNYTLMLEVEVIEGSFAIVVRTPTFSNVQGDSVYIQLSNNGDGAGLYMSMNKRVNWVYSNYFNSFPLGANRVCLKLTVNGSKIAVQVNDFETKYNYTKDPETNQQTNTFDTEKIQEGGDLVFALFNDTKTDIGTAKLHKIAFYNGVTAEENIAYNYTQEEIDAMSEAEYSDLVLKTTEKMRFEDNFYERTIVEISLIKTYPKNVKKKVGDKLTVNLMEYISTNVLISDLIVEELGRRGTIVDGVWTYTLTKEDFKSGVANFSLNITHEQSAGVLLQISVSEPSKGSGCGGCGSSVALGGSASLFALGAAALLIKKRRK